MTRDRFQAIPFAERRHLAPVLRELLRESGLTLGELARGYRCDGTPDARGCSAASIDWVLGILNGRARLYNWTQLERFATALRTTGEVVVQRVRERAERALLLQGTARRAQERRTDRAEPDFDDVHCSVADDAAKNGQGGDERR